MKSLIKYYLFAITVASCMNSQGQSSLLNLTFGVKDTNTIFSDVDNYVRATVPQKKNLRITARRAKCEKLNDTLFKIYTTNLGKDTFDVIADNKLVYRKIFEITPVTLGRFYVGAILKQSASNQEIIANRRLVYKNIECNCSIPHRIVSYKIKITSNSVPDADKEISIEGAMLNPQAISVIMKLNRKDTIEFVDIVALIGNGCPRSFDSFKLEID